VENPAAALSSFKRDLFKKTEFIVSELILVGTVHQDPLGTIRLSEFFQAHGPDCILLELSRYGLEFREKNQVLLHRALNRNVRQVSRESGICLKALMKHRRWRPCEGR